MSTLYGRFCNFVEKLVHGKYLAKISELEATCELGRENYQVISSRCARLSKLAVAQSKKIRAQRENIAGSAKALQSARQDLEVQQELWDEEITRYQAEIKSLEQRCLELSIRADRINSPSRRFLMNLPDEEVAAVRGLLPKLSNKDPKDKIKKSNAAHHVPPGLSKYMAKLAGIGYIDEVKVIGGIRAGGHGHHPKISGVYNKITTDYRVNGSTADVRLMLTTTAANEEQGEYVLQVVRRVS